MRDTRTMPLALQGVAPSCERPRIHARRLPAVTAISLLARAVMATPAIAQRAYETQMTGTPTGGRGSEVSFRSPWELSLDSKDDVWVADAHEPGGAVSEFKPSGEFEAHGVARCSRPPNNSAGATAGDMYVTSSGSGAPLPAVTRIDKEGGAAAFSATAGHIRGNQITGTPTGDGGKAPAGVARESLTRARVCRVRSSCSLRSQCSYVRSLLWVYRDSTTPAGPRPRRAGCDA